MKAKDKFNKGITLVALVITIIILLILATISIQALTSTGLFQNANKAKLEAKRGQIKEWLSLNLMEAQSTNYDKTDSEILEIARGKAEKSEELKKLGKTVNVDGEISTEEDGQTVPPYFDVIVDNDMYKVSMEEQEFIGEVGKIVPSVDFSATTTSKSITLKIITKRNQGGTVECYIKGENDSNYGTAQTATDNQYTFDNLDQGKKYSVKVVVTSRNGQKAEKEKEYTTLDIKELTTADIEFEYRINGTLINKQTWTNKEVNVMAKPKVDIAGYKIVTKKNDGTWQETDNQTLSENGIMYVALTDGRNYGSFAVGAVTNIDKTKPIITEATSTTNSISIKATDEEKGSGIVGYSITTTSSQPRNEEFTPVNNTKEFSTTINNQIQGTTYYAWVKDKAENINEVKTVKTENVTDLIKDVNLTFSYSTTGWTNGDVTVTANTTVSGYTLQTSTDGQDWANVATRTYSNNGMIYARLTDGINYGGVAAGSITNIDKTAPTYTNWWWGEVNSSVVRLYIQATDNESGIARVTAPTSTQSGGYSNWVWFDAAWDAGANAYRADITPATFGHYGQTYLTHLYIWDNAGNGGYYNAANVNVPNNINYGTSISSLYNELYQGTTQGTLITENGVWEGASYNGNYSHPSKIIHDYMFWNGGKRLQKQEKLRDKWLPMQNVVAGSTTYVLETQSDTNIWVGVEINASGLTSSVSFGDFKLGFTDGSYLTMRSAVQNGKIEPLVICSSSQQNGNIWDVSNILDGGRTGYSNYSNAYIIFKVKSTPLSSIQMWTNKSFNTTYDGLSIIQGMKGWELSTKAW